MDAKVGDKVVTVVNGFSGDVRVCEVETVDNGFGFARFEPGFSGRVYVCFADCEPAPAEAKVGDKGTMQGGNAAAVRRAFRRTY